MFGGTFSVNYIREERTYLLHNQGMKWMVILEDHLIALSLLQITYANLKTMSTVLTLPASKFEIWRQGRCSLRLPSLAFQVGLGIVGVAHLGKGRSLERPVFVCQHMCSGPHCFLIP